MTNYLAALWENVRWSDRPTSAGGPAAGDWFEVGTEYLAGTNALRSVHVELTGVPASGSDVAWWVELRVLAHRTTSSDNQDHALIVASGFTTSAGVGHFTQPSAMSSGSTIDVTAGSVLYSYEHSTNGTPVIRFNAYPRFFTVRVDGLRSGYADGTDWAAGIAVSETATTDPDL